MLISLTHGSSTKCLGEPFSIWTTCFLPAEFRQSLYSKYHPLMKIHCENISCHSVVCLFHSLIVSFTKQAFLLLMKYFIFMGCAFCVLSQHSLPNARTQRSVISSKNIIVLHFTFRYILYLEIIFV